MKFIYPETREKGVVSILSVIFFIILMSIITVSFLRVVTDEQTQVIQDDLSKGALAAARSGVEDAKRALLLCRTKSEPARTQCYNDLKNQSCPGIFASAQMRTDLGLQGNVNGDNSIKVGDPSPDNDNNERYTCVTISQNTPDYIGIMSDGLGAFIPLRSTVPFNQIRISWHQTSLDGVAAIPPATSPINQLNPDNPRRPDWQTALGNSYIAVPRIQLMRFDTTQTLNAQRDNAAGAFLVPSDVGASTVNVSAIAKEGMPKRPSVNCTGAQAGYLCSATLQLPALDAASQYFMFIKSFYGTPHYKVELLDNGTLASFQDVQPEVDSTGAAANVYKRLLSRIEYQADTFFTSNAIESGTSICKNFFVTIVEFNNPCASMLPWTAGLPQSVIGAAGIGTYCQVNVCAPGSGAAVMSWTETLANLSANDPADVVGCTWNFGDGSPNMVNANCNFGDTFNHTFPIDPTYQLGDSPAKPKKPYTVTLTVNLSGGGTATASHTFMLPENYP